jgi:hypothetical protein
VLKVRNNKIVDAGYSNRFAFGTLHAVHLLCMAQERLLLHASNVYDFTFLYQSFRGVPVCSISFVFLRKVLLLEYNIIKKYIDDIFIRASVCRFIQCTVAANC